MVEVTLENIKMKLTPQEAGRLGAFKRYAIYGNPGTQEGRRKGGLVSVMRFRSSLGSAVRKGFKLEKNIAIPQKTPLLAEFIGIVLGDGSISDYQVRVYFNAKTDAYYASFVKDMVSKLFNIDSRIVLRPKNTLDLIISSRGLVRFLLELGLHKGDKIKHQVDIPRWIIENTEYANSCLRGLMDTDGGIYFHTHITKGIKYRNMALCFTNRSKPLLCSTSRILFNIGIVAKNNLRERVFVYNRTGIKKYMEVIGSHNLNLVERFKSHKETRL